MNVAMDKYDKISYQGFESLGKNITIQNYSRNSEAAMKKQAIIIALTAVIVAAVAIVLFIITLPPEDPIITEPAPQPEENLVQQDIAEKPPYEKYLKNFLADTGKTFNKRIINTYVYYELFAADQTNAGFILHGIGEGWGGPIYMFIKTDTTGTIKRIHVWHHLETPLYVVDLDSFLSTFAEFRAEEQLEWQRDIHGLTGATLTAQAIIAAVQDAGRKAFEKGIFIER